MSDKKRSLSAAQENRRFLTEILCSPFADRKIRTLAEEGRLEELLPEVSAMAGVTQPPEYHPEGDVFDHTMLMLRHMACPDPLLAWSVLLHDVGKPLTRSVEPSGRIRFFGHEEEGALMTEEILKRFAFDSGDIEVIVHAVRHHMRFACVENMRPAKLERLISEPFFGLELELHRLDCISSHCRMRCFDFLLGALLRQKKEPELENLISGKDLLARGVPKGPALGKILQKVRELQIAGEICTREQALIFIENLLKG